MIVSIFDKCLGDDPSEPPPTYLKQIKLKAPESFDGTDDNDTFNVWLENLLCYLDTLRLRGLRHDQERSSFMRSCLTGKAAVWYQQTVTSPIRPLGHTTSRFDSIVGLYCRFVLTDQFTAAAKGFAGVRFEPHNGGVSRLYDQLVYYAEHMFQPPNEQAMKECIVEALPARFERELTISRGLHLQRRPLATFVSTAREIEEALDSFHSRRGDGVPSRPSTPSTVQPSSSAKGKHRTEPLRPSNSTVQPPHQELTARRDAWAPPRNHSNGTRGPVKFKDVSSRPTVPRAGPPSGQMKSIKCFKCGGVGHISTDPKCPQYRKDTHLHAQRIIEIGDTDESEDETRGALAQGDSAEGVTENDDDAPEEPPQSDYEDDYHLNYDSPEDADWNDGQEDDIQYFAMHIEPTFAHPDFEPETVPDSIVPDA
ncbi:hypothetical protein LXA43DRAFT_1097024 [Ganoderma leucocontextum]|nr:hypothetical protein LXA43DRAFT_1097024 [Ganoderma leucocontextum]